MSGEHNHPLRLNTGADSVLSWAGQSLGVISIVLFALGALPAEAKLFLMVITVLVMRVAGVVLKQDSKLQVGPDGACFFAGNKGEIESSAWLTHRYAVIRLHVGKRRRSVVISASRQSPDEYRKLLSWLRLGRWQL